MNDIAVSDQGSIVLFTPMTEAAQAFVHDNLALEPWQWMGPSFAVDYRYAADIIAGMTDDGLTVGGQI